MTLAAANGYSQFEELVTQVRNNDPAIMNRVMESDGYFHTRRATLSEITSAIIQLNTDGFRRRSPEDLPTIIFSCGKCRVGSTALTNLFGIAGIPAYYNPIKTALRHYVVESPGGQPWEVPSRSEHAFIFSKNMSGPYSLSDCIINPLQILVEASYPASRIELLMLDRDPYRALAAWYNKWGPMMPQERVLQHYVLSALNSIRIEAYAAEAGVRTSHYLYEGSRMPENAISRMFQRLGIDQLYNENVVNNWNEKGALDSRHSKIIFPPLSERHITPGCHASEAAYRYKERSADLVTAEDRALLERSGVVDCYRQTALAFTKELGLTLIEREQVFKGTPLDFSNAASTNQTPWTPGVENAGASVHKRITR